MSKKERINIVWLKRDLRLEDNESISNALDTGKRTLLLYVFENLLLNDGHYSERHFNFIKQSLKGINEELEPLKTKVLAITSDMASAMNQIQEYYKIDQVYSHVETGLLVTYNRDKDFRRYCRNNFIQWCESKNNGVERGLVNRKNWFENWETYMDEALKAFQPKEQQLLDTSEIEILENVLATADLETPCDTNFQKGGAPWDGNMPIHFLKTDIKNICLIFLNLKPQEVVAVDYHPISHGATYLFVRFFKKEKA